MRREFTRSREELDALVSIIEDTVTGLAERRRWRLHVNANSTWH